MKLRITRQGSTHVRHSRALTALIGITIAVNLSTLGSASAADLHPSGTTDSVGTTLVGNLPAGTTFLVNPDTGAVTGTLASGAEGVLNPDGTQVAYAKDPNPSCIPVPPDFCPYVPDLVVSNVDGTDQRTLAPGGAQNPQWAPNGKHIVFDGNGIEWVQPDGSGRETLASGFRPAVSPDGKQIAFFRQVIGPDGDYQGSDVYAMDIATRQVRQLTTNHLAWPEKLSWSPDGRHIVYSGDPGVAIVDTVTGEVTAVDFGNDYFIDASPVYSPDGSHIAFSGYDKTSGENGLFNVDSDGSNVRRISDLAANLTQWVKD
jgi:TolB protein